MTLSPGTRLGSYEILAPLGAGGMGEVYRARDTRLGREVAIKALPASLALDPARRGRFEREAQILASLNHPNIGSIYGLEETAGALHLVLELVSGETLSSRLERGPLPAREALSVGIQIAAAVEAAHERGIVHRDLKPGNVMVTRTGAVKVLDFGLAKGDLAMASQAGLSASPTLAARPDATIEGTLIGTVAYMSPEQARGNPVDRRSDIWSFGCVVFECFAGRPAFGGDTASDQLARILEREPDWGSSPGNLPPRVREVLKRCLRKNADERPRDIRDVALELADIAASSDKGDAPREQSIAVLPFENLSGPADEYFADGITEEILGALVQVEGLRVAARTSCFAFKGKREDLRQVGEKLDVAAVLEGSVRRAGNRLRISVQLVDVSNGYQLWSERYDREMTDVFEIQDEIAGAIAKRLRLTLHDEGEGARGRRGTTNLEAYEWLLRGRALQLRRGSYLLEAIPCFERAIELEPDYTEALALLSDSYRLLGVFGVAPFKPVMSKAKELALRALAVDPDSPEANATYADVLVQHEGNWPGAEESYQRALRADPRHVRSRCERAVWGFAYRGLSVDEVLAELRLAIEYEPLNSWVHAMNSLMFGFTGRHEDSIRAAGQALEIDPDSFLARWCALAAPARAGDYARVFAQGPGLLAASGRNPWVMGLLGWAYGRTGQWDKARAVADEVMARARFEFVSPYWLAVVADAGGLKEEAFGLFERAIAEGDPMARLARLLAMLDGVMADPRFKELEKRCWG